MGRDYVGQRGASGRGVAEMSVLAELVCGCVGSVGLPHTWY